jgi:hypothetical protein
MTMQVPENAATAATTAPPEAAINEAATTPAPTVVETPSEPLTPGEAAKAARVRAEERSRLERVKRKSDALHAERQKFDAERKAHAESMAAAEVKRTEEMATLRRELEEYKTGNPLLKPGVDVNTHLRELVAQGTPEAQVITLQKQLEKQRAEFEARFEALNSATKAREEEEAKRLAEIQKTQEESSVRQFTLWATSPEQAKVFKFLNAEYTQSEVFAQARAVVNWAKENGKTYSGHEVAAYLEKRAETEHNNRAERRSALLGATPLATPAAVTPATKVAQPANGKKAPVQAKQKTHEEQVEADLALLRKASEADRIARTGKK